MRQLRPYPQVVVTAKAARSLKGGHPWVFEGEVLRVEPAPSDGRAPANGDVVDVVEENGTYQGTGLLSQQSKIRVRVVSRNANDRFDASFWRRKIEWAWEHRKVAMGSLALPGCEPDTNCCRVIFSEADGFPGLIVDRYEDVLVSQVGTVGMQLLRPTIYPLLLQVLQADGVAIRGIYERNDSPARAKEGLPLHKGFYDFAAPGAVAEGLDVPALPVPDSARVLARENGILFDLDIENSQKTGFFLDQKYNRRAVRNIAAGRRVLDCFCHVGPFGLNAAAGGAAFVREVDVSQTAIDLARENAHLNGLDATMDFTCANVLEYLPALVSDKKRLHEEGGPFDLIVLDPPAFTKSRGTVDHAAHGYREINEWAMRLL
ncbi:MAG: class I SAM-dependent rRNA methyltransferase, partial [Parafannyhessea umbonata]|uniref:class I SAM-dependent rRNA methyltransferase n=1 Tax=Parafannyhessea umbonata TaxID=604330 RepID=UPI0026F12F3C